MTAKKPLFFLIVLGTGIILGWISWPAYRIGTGLIGGRHVQTLDAPKGPHSASLLKKHNLSDINFIVKVDGDTVYVSPDFMGFPDHIYRETLVWDESGSVVVFEMMGKRVFAFDANEKRKLGKGALAGHKFYPSLTDNYFYAFVRDIDEEVEEK
ncbi:MAG: hypothetical protein IPI64_13960 [Chloracidobacterium sp.]|nr:hypothetical protein [Chloracidobacterium sp.]